jgi:hypothetical protein
MSDESLLANFGERPFHEETKATFPKANGEAASGW